MIREAGQWKRGYLKLKIWGYGVERFLNVCGKTGIDIWGVRAERTSCDPVCFCCMELKDFHRIRPIVRKTKVHIRIQKRLGLPFFLHRNRKRWILFAGPLLTVMILMVLSMFLWKVTFEGNNRYTDDALMTYLEKAGIHPGILKRQVSLSQLEEQIRLDYPEILWVSAQISGTQLSIKLRENDAVFSVPEKDTSPGNLVASSDAVITRLVIRQGKAMVKEGDQVEQGQVLAEGTLELMNDNGELLRKIYVRADGEVYGTVRHTYRKRLAPMKKIQIKEERRILLKCWSESLGMGDAGFSESPMDQPDGETAAASGTRFLSACLVWEDPEGGNPGFGTSLHQSRSRSGGRTGKMGRRRKIIGKRGTHYWK